MKLHTLAALLVLALAVGLLQARPAAITPAVETRIGVVDLDELLTNAPAAVRAQAAFEAGRKAKQDTLDARAEELRRAGADLEKQKPSLDPQTYETRRKAFEESFLELQKTHAELERELAQERQVLVSNLLKLAAPELQKIAKSDGLAAILDKNSTVWFDPALDVTERLKTELK
jgi:Skp family chaperone for outer membrane proteins